MVLSHARRLRLAAKSSEGQQALMRELGFGKVPYVEHRAQIAETASNHLSRVEHRLRREYDDVIPFTLPSELGTLLGQLDRAP
jgi:hypothetical protein